MIGCGGISDLHFRTLAGFHDVEVVAAVDVRPERLEWAREKHGILAGFTDWVEMLNTIKPDAVDVCTPNAVHAPAVIDSLNAGCHATTEKPMAMTPKESQKMIDAAKRNKKSSPSVFSTAFIRRRVF